MNGPDPRQPMRHPKNVDGPFYVVNGDCMACGAPELQAPNLMTHNERGHCYFLRQPDTEAETDHAICGVWASCCGAVRYGGADQETLIRFADLGLSEQCDFKLVSEPPRAVRNYVSFRFFANDPPIEGETARTIMACVAQSLGKGRGVRALRIKSKMASFEYFWGHQDFAERLKVHFKLTLQLDRWLLRILRADQAPTSFVISVNDMIKRDSRFATPEWFTEEEWKKGRVGRPKPY